MKYEFEERLIWFEGDLVPIKEAKVMAVSPTAQYGLNVFEGIPCYWNPSNSSLFAFRLDDHYKRLIKSAKLLEIENKYNISQMKSALFETLWANEFEENLSVRQTLFVDDFGSWSSSGPASMFIIPTPRRKISAEYTKKGLKACISSWTRINDDTLPPRIKCGANYINSRFGQREALRNGYDTCIFLNKNGSVSEGPGSCLFIVQGKKLITPCLTDSVLESITRDSVIKIANYLNLEVEIRSIDRTELYSADEVFLCGSAMEITPVNSVDQYNITSGESLVTNRIYEVYLSAAMAEVDTFRDWVTRV